MAASKQRSAAAPARKARVRRKPRIDVHNHVIPQTMLDAIARA